MNGKFDRLGFYPADILLPKDVDMEKWAVVACDQFTSEPEYWQRVEYNVGDAPSTLRLILPEADLKAPDVDERIGKINASMDEYLKRELFTTLKDSLIYVEREQSDGKIRHGLVGMVDLEAYDFTGKKIVLFATAGSSGFGNTLAELQPSAPDATFTETTVLTGIITDGKIQKLIDACKVKFEILY